MKEFTISSNKVNHKTTTDPLEFMAILTTLISITINGTWTITIKEKK